MSKKNKKNEPLPDHIEEYFKDNESSKEAIQSRELFDATNENIQFKTDLTDEDICLISTLSFNDKFLESRGIKPVYSKYFLKYMKLRVSLDRKSRSEFVGMTSKEIEEELNNLNKSLSPITKPRK